MMDLDLARMQYGSLQFSVGLARMQKVLLAQRQRFGAVLLKRVSS
jgi:hypothetical protein